MTRRPGWRMRRAALTLAATALLSPLAACGDGGSTVAPPTAAPSSTASTAASTATPLPTLGAAPAGASKAPLSPFESDPAVQALRLEYFGSAKAINARLRDVPEWHRSSTPARRARLAKLFSTEYGLKYPGPAPFIPLGVRSISATERQVVYCIYDEGWGQDPKTGRPARPTSILKLLGTVVKTPAGWQVAQAHTLSTAGCADVVIPQVRF